MSNGTQDFYATVANVIPVVILAYILSFRVFETVKDFISRVASGYIPEHAGFVTAAVGVLPFAAIIMAIVGELECLKALYSGHATHIEAEWTIAALEVIGAAIVAHMFAFVTTYASRRWWQPAFDRQNGADNDGEIPSDSSKGDDAQTGRSTQTSDADGLGLGTQQDRDDEGPHCKS